jgi:hypothetical protein
MDPYITPKYFLRPPQHRKKNYYRVQPFCETVELVPPGISLVLFFDCCCSGGLFDHSNKQFPINATKLLWSKRTRLPSSVVAFTATSSVAYNGDNRYWFEHNSIFTHALLKVIEGNDKLRNIYLIQFIDDMVKDYLGQLAAESLKK